jgi:hypothetical protein
MSLALYLSRVRSNEMLGRSCARPSTYSFNVVPVGVKDERSVVVLGILRAKPRLSMTDTTGSQCLAIEGVHGKARACEKCDMQACNWSLSASNPEYRIRRGSKPYHFNSVGVLVTFHEPYVQWRKSANVKLAASLKIADGEIDMVDHLAQPRGRPNYK